MRNLTEGEREVVETLAKVKPHILLHVTDGVQLRTILRLALERKAIEDSGVLEAAEEAVKSLKFHHHGHTHPLARKERAECKGCKTIDNYEEALARLERKDER